MRLGYTVSIDYFKVCIPLSFNIHTPIYVYNKSIVYS